MTLAVLKLVLVPSLVAIVTLGVRRWGPAVGGWLSALPVVAGPVLMFYGIEQGAAFTAEAAHATLAGLIATTAFGVAYARTSIRQEWYVCVLVGWTTFAAAVWILFASKPSLMLSLVGLLAATAAGRWALPPVRSSPGTTPAPRADLLLRMLAAAALVLVLTGLAHRLGPRLSGLLNAFPILTTIVVAFTHAQRGWEAGVAFVNGYLRAIPGFGVFCVVMAVAIQPLGLTLALVCALAAQLAATALILRSPRFGGGAEA